MNEGWAILLYAVLATLGHPDMAMEKTLALPENAFTSAGGSGHSLTNTLWYIATRPTPEVPYDIQNPQTSINSKAVTKSDEEKMIDCGCPDTCTGKVLSTRADGFALTSDSNGFTCKERIQWLIKNKGINELGACREVAGNEYKSECGGCDPALCGAGLDTVPVRESVPSGCPPCDAHVCNSDINRCQIPTSPYVCYEGASRGGCSATPWGTDGVHCSACCELFEGCEVATASVPLSSNSGENEFVPNSQKEEGIDCGCPDTCKSETLNSNAGGYTCKERIQWLIHAQELEELGACRQVAGNEYHSQCGACDPVVCRVGLNATQAGKSARSGCPPCDVGVCNSEINLCQATVDPYLCFDGAARGGCSASPWALGGGSPCSSCCNLLEGCE